MTLDTAFLRRHGARPLLAMLLACAGLSAQAASFRFAGVTDSGTLAGASFSGSFAYQDPAPGLDGSVDLAAFDLRFAGQTYSLATADAGWTPAAVFAGGQLVGLDYQDLSGSGAPRPQLQLVAGFTELGQAYLAYGSAASGVEGFGSYTLSAVPEPASLALLLAGLGLVGAAARRRG